MTTERDLVLVTGAAGFVASHCILQLLQAGYRVRGTLRDLARSKEVEQVLSRHIDLSDGRLTFVRADLSADEGWDTATSGCQWVLHVASPVPRQAPKRPEDVINPARDGALRVLRAATRAKVRRVVLTSSTAAVLWGHERDGTKTYAEDTWSSLTSEVGPYEQSKTLAERAAWDYHASLNRADRFELVVLNPGLVLGPLLGANASVSGEVVRKLITAEFPGCPDLGFAAVDVRDVASAHVDALTNPAAANQRFILAIEHASVLQIAEILSRHFAHRGFKVPTRRLPSWVLRVVAQFDKTAALVIPELGKRQDVSSARPHAALSWQPRGLETMVVDMAESMIEYGVVRPRKRAVASPPPVVVRAPRHASPSRENGANDA